MCGPSVHHRVRGRLLRRRLPGSLSGPGTQPSPGQALQELSVFVDDAAKPHFELRGRPAALDSLHEGRPDHLAYALALVSGERLGILATSSGRRTVKFLDMESRNQRADMAFDALLPC
jgi:hypothetical protein